MFPDDDALFSDPRDVDKLLAKEMFELDLKSRNEVLEGVHGIEYNHYKEETPEIIEKAMRELEAEISRIPPEEKGAYLRSKEIPNSYIQTRDYLVRFWRCMGAQKLVPVAAQRAVKFAEILVDLFGEYALKRPVRLSDFSKKELQILRFGRYQFLPFGDRSGRRVLALFRDEVWESFPGRTKAKIMLYLNWVAGNDVETQKKGIVIVVWFDHVFKISRRPKNIVYKDHEVSTLVASAIHICSPDTPLFRFRQAVAVIRIGRARRYIRTHLGDSMENRYALQGFGIEADQIPISYTGKVKLAYIRQWIAVRSAIESHYDDMVGQTVPSEPPIIEYPKSQDVVFRQGSSCTSHAANLAFRTLIMAKVMDQEQSRDVSGVKIRRKKMVLDIVTEIRIRNAGRFLIWNDSGGWTELHNDEMIHSKIEYLIKELRKTIRLRQTWTNAKKILDAETSMLRFDYTFTQQSRPALSYDIHSEIDDSGLIEAACCVASCFNMNGQNIQKRVEDKAKAMRIDVDIKREPFPRGINPYEL